MKLFEGGHAKLIVVFRVIVSAIAIGLAGLVACCLSGCQTPLKSAAEVANYSAAVGEEAREMVHDDCTAVMAALAAQPPSDERKAKGAELAKRCDPVEASYEAFRQAHLALVAGILRAQRDLGISVGELIALADATAQAVIKIEQDLRTAHTGAQAVKDGTKSIAEGVVDAVKGAKP